MGATTQGTKTYFEKQPLAVPPIVLGRTGWTVSPVGFGGYRINDEEETHRDALKNALTSGCNLIDTSTNYGNGSSETLIGQVLKEFISEGNLKREEIVVVTKAGYVQGANLKLVRDRAAKNIPFPEMVEFSGDCWHCISPEFLKDQLTRSLERLKLPQLDVLLLHNPEYFLKAGGEHGEYYRRIEAAFRYLETEVKAGRIQYYGISSNTFPESKEAQDYTSLEIVTELAEKISPDHHFAVIQFPFNLYEPGAALEENNSGLTVAAYARTKKLGTLVNRPLNAFSPQGLIRLADFPAHDRMDIVGEFKEAMTRATALEAQYPGKSRVPANQIAWGHILRENFQKLSDLDTWKNFLHFRVLPTLREAFATLEEETEYRDWVKEYREAASQLFEAFSAYLEHQASVKSDQIAGLLDHLSPELQGSETLSQKAIRLYRSIPGIDCILVGMRQTEYVRDVLTLQPPVSFESARRVLIELSIQRPEPHEKEGPHQ